MEQVEQSRYVVPDPPQPAWKSADWAQDVLPPADPARQRR
jgi:hypothetical protein